MLPGRLPPGVRIAAGIAVITPVGDQVQPNLAPPHANFSDLHCPASPGLGVAHRPGAPQLSSEGAEGRLPDGELLQRVLVLLRCLMQLPPHGFDLLVQPIAVK
jgi:hypothetical protein